MKLTSLLIVLLFYSITEIYSQNNYTGFYSSNNQSFEDEIHPIKNAEHFQTLKIEINISDLTEMGYLKITFPEDNLYYKWDITEKLDVNFDENNKTLITSYKSYWNLENYRTDKIFEIVFIKDYNTNSFHVVVQNSEASTRTWYYDLEKL